MDSKLKLSVIMITYNHEKYIEEAINGVLMQKCVFPIELIIADDCSTDESHKIIDKIKNKHKNGNWIKYTKHQKNLGIKLNFIWSLKEAKGKYIALCDGDDFWIDEFKLQKQVDFLELNNDYGLIGSQRVNYNETLKKYYNSTTNKINKSYTFEDTILGDTPIATLTTLFRKKYIDDLLEINNSNENKLFLYDYTLWFYISYKSKIHILKDVTAVYRIVQNSTSRKKNKWLLKKKYFNDFIILTKTLGLLNEPNIKKAYYNRAKSFYLLSAKSNDWKSLKIIEKILSHNNDYFRVTIIKIIKKLPQLIRFFELIEKIFLKIKHK